MLEIPCPGNWLRPIASAALHNLHTVSFSSVRNCLPMAQQMLLISWGSILPIGCCSTGQGGEEPTKFEQAGVQQLGHSSKAVPVCCSSVPVQLLQGSRQMAHCCLDIMFHVS